MLRKLWERNLSVIPVIGKRAFLPAWTQYCERLPTEQEISEWEKLYSSPYYGVGLCLGPATNIVIWDCDSDSKDIKELCPPSPIMKFGSKGFSAAFLRGEGLENAEYFRKNIGPNKDKKDIEGIEIFVSGRQTVLPPSINPDNGMMYKYLTVDTFENFDFRDLPRLNSNDVIKAARYISGFSKVETTRGKEQVLGPGRNNRLTAVVCAILCGDPGKSDEAVAEELLSVDAKEHKSPLFMDPSESDFKKAGGNSFKAALSFVRRHKSQLEKKGMILDIKPESINVDAFVSRNVNFPKVSGLIGSIQQAVLKVSRTKQDELALGASLAILSTLCSNRFHIRGRPAITHLYTMNVARSGQGKGAGFYIANKLLGPGPLEKYNLLGLRNYSSIAAFVDGLPGQRSRLDMIDEFGGVLEGFSSGSQLSKDVELLLTELYTSRGDYWGGHYTKTNGSMGGCYSPAVSLYANVQENILLEVSKASMIESGLLSRFLYFSGKKEASFNPFHNDTIDVSSIAEECISAFPFYPISGVQFDGSIAVDLGKIEPVRAELVMTAATEEYRRVVDEQIYKKEMELDRVDDRSGAIFYSRFLQIAERIAIINAVSNSRREVTKDDFDFGMAVVTACHDRAKGYLMDIGAAKIDKKIRWLQRSLSGVAAVSHSKLLKNSHLDATEFSKIINTAIQSGIIKKIDGDATYYSLCQR